MPRRYNGRELTESQYAQLLRVQPDPSKYHFINFLYTVVGVIGLLWLSPLVGRWFSGGHYFVSIGARILSVVLLILPFWWFFSLSPVAVRERRRQLRKYGLPMCSHCGYDLADRDPNSGDCPECGRNLAEMPPVHLPDDGE